MNKHKVGRPYDFPNSYIEFLSFPQGWGSIFRTGWSRVQLTHCQEYISFIQDICFTQIRRRMIRLLKGKKPSEIVGAANVDSEEPITAAVDSTGLTTTTKGILHLGQVEEREKEIHQAARPCWQEDCGFQSDEWAHWRLQEIRSPRERGFKEEEEENQDRKGVRRLGVRFLGRTSISWRRRGSSLQSSSERTQGQGQEALRLGEKKLFSQRNLDWKVGRSSKITDKDGL